MALALYRKYRPKTFTEVIGQEHVTEPLSQALTSGRLHHAYLFSGPRGCGKTSSARILARSLNCEQGPTPQPCGECDSCRALAPDGPGSIDVIEIDAASHGGVDDARDLRERAFFAPVSSRFKVYVIDEAHMVSSAGFNALLKLVEEPPEYVKFVFATTEPEKVLGTIRSRTHHYPFRLIPPGVLRPFLERLCVAEQVTVEPAVFPLVVRAGAGSARDCLSVLDQLIAGAGSEGVTYQRAVALLGVTDTTLLDEMCDALVTGDGAAVFAAVDRVAEAGHDPRRFATDLLDRFRDLIILNRVPDAVGKGLLDYPDDQMERMSAHATRLGPATLSRYADMVHKGLSAMRGATAPRLLLELICARMLLPAADGSSDALLQRLEQMERRLEQGGAVAAQPARHPVASESAAPRSIPSPPRVVPPPPVASPPASVSSPAPVVPPAAAQPSAAVPGGTAPTRHPGAPGAGGQRDAESVRGAWDEVLAMVGHKSKRAAAVVREATVRDVQGETLVLLFKHSVHANMLSGSPDLLVEALYELFGGRWKIQCVLGGDAGATGFGGPAGQRSAARPAARQQNDASGSGHGGQAAEPGHPGQPAGQGHGRSAAANQSFGAQRPARQGPGPVAGPGPAAGTGPVGGPNLGTGAGPVGGAGPITGPNGGPVAGPNAVAGQNLGASSVEAEEWPATAVPGALAAAADSTGGQPAGQPEQRSAVATMARPPAAGDVDDATQAQGEHGAGRVATPAGQSKATPLTTGTPFALGAARAAREAAREAASAAGRGGRAQTRTAQSDQVAKAAQRPGGGSSAWDGPAEEPPYDPEYDGPAFPGFDPGDEPMDDAEGGSVVRESSEEQALRLLSDALGAERIAGPN